MVLPAWHGSGRGRRCRSDDCRTGSQWSTPSSLGTGRGTVVHYMLLCPDLYLTPAACLVPHPVLSTIFLVDVSSILVYHPHQLTSNGQAGLTGLQTQAVSSVTVRLVQVVWPGPWAQPARGKGRSMFRLRRGTGAVANAAGSPLGWPVLAGQYAWRSQRWRAGYV